MGSAILLSVLSLGLGIFVLYWTIRGSTGNGTLWLLGIALLAVGAIAPVLPARNMRE
jgi:hypothetical protein